RVRSADRGTWGSAGRAVLPPIAGTDRTADVSAPARVLASHAETRSGSPGRTAWRAQTAPRRSRATDRLGSVGGSVLCHMETGPRSDPRKAAAGATISRRDLPMS